jgi:DNA polymerase III epsilon subunit-like protein
MTVREAGGFKGDDWPERHSLDALCERFGITPHDRHTALGDAFLTAQILLRVLKEAGKLGMWNLEDLHAWYADQPFPFTNG